MPRVAASAPVSAAVDGDTLTLRRQGDETIAVLIPRTAGLIDAPVNGAGGRPGDLLRRLLCPLQWAGNPAPPRARSTRADRGGPDTCTAALPGLGRSLYRDPGAYAPWLFTVVPGLDWC